MESAMELLSSFAKLMCQYSIAVLHECFCSAS